MSGLRWDMWLHRFGAQIGYVGIDRHPQMGTKLSWGESCLEFDNRTVGFLNIPSQVHHIDSSFSLHLPTLAPSLKSSPEIYLWVFVFKTKPKKETAFHFHVKIGILEHYSGRERNCLLIHWINAKKITLRSVINHLHRQFVSPIQ